MAKPSGTCEPTRRRGPASSADPRPRQLAAVGPFRRLPTGRVPHSAPHSHSPGTTTGGLARHAFQCRSSAFASEGSAPSTSSRSSLCGTAGISHNGDESVAEDEQRASRLALAPRLLLWKAIASAPTGRVTGLATRQSRPPRNSVGTPRMRHSRRRTKSGPSRFRLGRMLACLTERVGFEPTRQLTRPHDFQSCTLSRSVTSPERLEA
jgi:hypothetical protein